MEFFLYLTLFKHLMPTLNQVSVISRIKKMCKSKSPKLKKNPQKKAICTRVLTISPKKPNSANRRVVKARIINSKIKLTAKVPGETHSLQQHSTILVRGAKVKDLIGVSYAVVRGKYDLLGVSNRKTRRSFYGVKKIVK
jgi:small subunit ribosomal protein S12